jgi:hypothetical protein
MYRYVRSSNKGDVGCTVRNWQLQLVYWSVDCKVREAEQQSIMT